MSDDTTDQAMRKLREAADQLRKTTGSKKDAVVARIRARRSGLLPTGALADAEVVLAELQRRTQQEREGATSVVAAQAEEGIPVEARLLPRQALDAVPAAGQPGVFPRSTTLRLALRHPALFTLAAVLILKASPARLLVLSRLLLPLLKK
ncbi:MAG: hypothetical protein GAK30_03358 [Paracidovorax wautersii]|uniref:Uncharacterized protein n=1 Tax=Paracidovorax wautersii TaxID=1177982 RepID=A0A7V8FL93_9BURK|nr:MAG: hypothetical protein GAK30_03358 [Paracidovorax wautersii]